MLSLFREEELFDEGKKQFTSFQLQDTVLTLHEQFFEKQVADRLYHFLLKTTNWKQRERKMYDRIIPDPRLTAWYGKQGDVWNPELLFIKDKVQENCGIVFDSVLLNLYRNGQDSVSWHSDTVPASGKHHAIASVSFGETRPFRIRHKFNKAIAPVEIPLTHGSFLLMGETMQDYWEHHIPKTSRHIAPRINLTFRIT